MKSSIEPAALPAVLLVEDDVVLRDRVLIPRLSSYDPAILEGQGTSLIACCRHLLAARYGHEG